ncbi:MAG TPA: CpXC domain-containing protein [Bellilinea sp.]|nr:CpXC domain-containing protein [Bellilinea sp.]
MAKVQTSCPRCKTLVATEVEQVFDLNQDPQAKQRLLSGQVNVLHCPNCGYEGMVGTPVIYHDPEKELLLTFFPSEMGLPLNEQERMIGPLINQVVNRLPLEKRKAYILRPQSMLTFQTMIERILEGDGISRQMIDDQQKRLALLQRLLTIPSAESRLEVIKQEEALIDENFFSMFSRLMEATMAQGDERSARALADLQQELVQNTAIGKKIQEQSREAQEVITTLNEASKSGLTREKLVDIFIDSVDSEVRLTTLVSLVRNGLDYTFFTLLTEKINTFEGDKKAELEAMREKVLGYIKVIDDQRQGQMQQTKKLLDAILATANPGEAVKEHLQEIDEYFMELVDQELKNARAAADLNRIGKLQKISSVIEEATAPPPELELIEKLLGMENYDERMAYMQSKAEMITPEFTQMLSGLIAQSEAQKQPEDLVNKLKEINRIAVRISMMAAMKK